VNGGDGTLMRVLTEILGGREFGGRLPLIAPLRGGRTNMSALDLGAHRDPVRGLEAVLAAAFYDRMHERIVQRHVLRVEIRPEREVLYGMFFGAGVIHRGIETVHRVLPRGRARGVFGATLVTAAWLARLALLRDHGGVLTPDKLQLKLDEELLPGGEYTLAMASTLRRLFAGMRPFWGKGSGEVPFTAIEAGALKFAQSVPGILAGIPSEEVNESNGYCSRRVQRALIGANCGFTVDGELVDPGPDRVVSVTATDRVRFVRA